ncbi:MAG: GMC oxidoreductase [Gemmatimonadales bacterium]
MELDARSVSNDAIVSGDVCIIGAGPVGLALAGTLAAHGHDVALIESGTGPHDATADELNDGDLVGDLAPDLRVLRARAIGGTASIWNTFLDGAPGARFVPFDPEDFTPRAWRAGAVWPIPYHAVARYYPAAMEFCGLGGFDFRAETMAHPDRPPPPLDGARLAAGVYQVGPTARITVDVPSAIRASSRVMLVRGATATRVDTSADRSRITAVHWSTLDGRRGSVRAARVVLAAGGIENPRRLLLWANGTAATQSAWLGRGFMQHPWENSLEIVSKYPAFSESHGFFSPHRNPQGVGIMGRIALSPALIADENIGNAGIYVVPLDQPHVFAVGSARAAAHRAVPSLRLRRAIGSAALAAAATVWRARGRPCTVEIYLEQLPHFENRVTLSNRRDIFGQPLPVAEWRLLPDDHANLVRTRDIVARELERAGLGRVRPTRGIIAEHENHHHIGATRMHPDPALGVVDTDQRVHGMENLYVAGASVFPTGGFANPTLTAIALALRLADHLAAA